MLHRFLCITGCLFLLSGAIPPGVLALQGDADGNGVLDMDDARTVARYAAGQAASLPNPGEADATQDGQVDMEDAFVIAKRVSGHSRILVAAPRHGRTDRLRVGDLIRIEVFEKFYPFHITGGSVRIVSGSTGYDSGKQTMTFARDGRSLYYHWNTAGLALSDDYVVDVVLTDNLERTAPGARSDRPGPLRNQSQATAELTPRRYEPHLLAETVDAYCPAPGLPLVFSRVINNDSGFFPYLGPLGRGWTHNYDLSLEEYTDGRVEFHGPGKISRIYQSNADGTYTAEPGDYGILTRDPSGWFKLQEKNGLAYLFQPDLKLAYLEDPHGNRISTIYDAAGNLVEIRHSCGSAFSLEYNDQGRITRLTDHAGRATTYEYDVWPAPPAAPMNLAFLYNHILVKVTDPAGQEIIYTYSLGQSGKMNYRLISVQHPDGTFDHFEHDAEARIIRHTGTWGANPVTYAYEAGGVTRITDAVGGQTLIQVDDKGLPVAVTHPDGGQEQIQYDTAHNPVLLSDPYSRPTNLAYDAYGNTIQATNPMSETVTTGYDLRFHKPAWISDPLGHSVSFSYDGQGNLTGTTFADGTQAFFSYDAQGNLTRYTDPAGRQTRYAYNANGQMESMINALGDTASFGYSAAGNLETVTDAGSNAMSFEYDPTDRITRQVFPDGSSERYTYLPGGNVDTFTNRQGDVIDFGYDVTGRLSTKTFASGKSYAYQYDYRGLLSQVDSISGSTRSLDGYYEYDLARRLTLAKVPGRSGAETYDIAYNYDLAGNRTAMVYPDGYTLNYEYDDANRLVRIADAGDNTLVAYAYDAAGRCLRRTLGNGTYTTYSYDDVNRLTRLTNNAPDDSVQSRFDYAYNDAGMRLSMTTLEGVHTYTYDDIDQLTRVQYPDGRTVDYVFDAAGNRVSVDDDGQVTGYTTNNLDQYTQAGAETFTYDLNGNLANRTSGGQNTQYTWDEENRLVAMDRNGVHIDYRYDHQGRLSAKVIGGQEQRFVWDGVDLIALMDAEGQIVKRFIYGNNIDEVVLMSTGGENHWGQQDGLGSVIAATNDSGSVRAACDYDVYGNIRSGGLGPVPQRLAGMWWDEDAGLYYVRSRWYDANLGRFLSIDPIGLAGGDLNLYRYVGNNPLDFVDPMGEFGWLRAAVSHAFSSRIGVAVGNLLVRGMIFLVHNPWGQFAVGGTIGALGGNVIGNLLYDFFHPEDKGNWISLIDLFMPPDDFPGWPPPPGGQCPTFIQLPPQNTQAVPESSDYDIIHEELAAGIMVPINSTLLRSDIPIFGIAGGKQFKSYRVEYGRGRSPDTWHLIAESSTPQEKNEMGIAEMRLMQGDLDIRGNLASWNTGLKNWDHLPWHPPEDPIDLNGIYTLRLTVEGKNGRTVEDRVTAEVGRVIAQCLPGLAVSPDQRVALHFPEQALTHSFRIYTILPLSEIGEEEPAPPQGCRFAGPVYRIREPGDRFIKEVALTFDLAKEKQKPADLQHMGIARYDNTKQTWIHLPTRYDESGRRFSTPLKALPAPTAIYALVYDPGKKTAPADASRPLPAGPAKPLRPGLLADNGFETDLGTFKPRDGVVGAALSRDKTATADGSYCLRLENTNFGGDFAATVIDTAFDVREYGTMAFDYRIGPQTRIHFFLKVNGRWYCLGLAGETPDFYRRDVNIANMGALDGILADDRWHTASVDLHYLLGRQTGHTRVDEIILADWRAGGYMKLDFGDNPRGAVYYLDNVKFTGPGRSAAAPPTLVVDDFNAERSSNLFGGACGTYGTPGADCFSQQWAAGVPRTGNKRAKDDPSNQALALTFDTTGPGTYGGYWTAIKGQNLAGFHALSFWVKGQSAVPPLILGIRNLQGIEGRTDIRPYLDPPRPDGWRRARIPLSALTGLDHFSSPDVLFFSVSHQEQSGKGMVCIDQLQFETEPYPVVATFGGTGATNLLGGTQESFANGAAAIDAAVMPDPQNPSEQILRISYGGSIGKDYGPHGGFSFAGWQAGLGRTDARGYTYLTLRVKGEKGGETPNFYLADPAKRVALRSVECPPVTGQWQTLRLPLAQYGAKGVDLSCLDKLQVIFEWKEQSGTLYVDDIRFE